MASTAAWLCLGLGGFCLSWASILVKWCALPPLAVAAWRLSLAAGLMSLWPEARKTCPLPFPTLALGGLLLAIHFASWIASLSLLPVYLSVCLVTTSPLWVALATREHHGSRLPLLLAFSGTLLLSAQSLGGPVPIQPLGLLLAILGAWAMAAYLLWARAHQPAAGEPGYALRVYAVAALILMLGASLICVPLGGYQSGQWMCLLGMALIPQTMGHTLLLMAVRYGSASWASLSILLEPVGSTLLAVLLLHEPLGATQGLGMSLTLMGLLGIARGQRP